MGTVARRASQLVGAVALLVVTACTPTEAADPPRRPPDGVSVTLEQWREDEARHTLQVAVRNDGTTPIRIVDVQLVTDSFEVLPPEPVDTVLGTTPRTDLPIPYGTPNCLPDRVPPVAPAAVVATIGVDDAPPRRVRFELPHPDPLLDQLVRTECAAYLVTRVATIEFGPTWRPAGDAMRGTLEVTRRTGTEPVTIVETLSSTHFLVDPVKPTANGDPVGVLEPDATTLSVPVLVRALRCDAHSLADAKKAFLFPVRAAVGDGEPQRVTFPVPKRTERTLLNHALDTC